MSCLPVLVLGMGSALAHLLRSDASAACADARYPAGAAGDREMIRQRLPDLLGHDQPAPSTYVAFTAPESGTTTAPVGRYSDAGATEEPASYPACGIRGRPPARRRLSDAYAAAARVVASGQQVSRRSLRSAGLHGSNADLGMLAHLVRARPPAGSPRALAEPRIWNSTAIMAGRAGEGNAERNRHLPRWPGKVGLARPHWPCILAHEYSAKFPDGQLYVDLRGMGPPEEALNPADVLADFLRSLGIDSANIPDSLDRRAAMFRSRMDGKRFLIVLDNAAGEKQVEPLLPASNKCAVLPSRARLSALAGVKRLDMGVMKEGEAQKLFAQLVPRDLIEAAPAEAMAIVERCGCLPLAIRIAGAQVAESRDLIGFDRDLARESTRLKALKHRNLDVRASLGLSYEYGLRSGAQRSVPAARHRRGPHLSVVGRGGGLTGETPEQADAIVRELTRAQLLENTGRDAAGQIRFRFHDLVRDLAREFLRDARKPTA